MEIKFELENSDIDCVFEPEFDVAINCVDIEKVQWNFQNGTHTATVASLLRSTPKYEHASTHLPKTVRLCDRCNEDIIR